MRALHQRLWQHLGWVVVAHVALTGSLEAQQRGEAPRPSRRQATILGGVGNAMGWFGAQGEWYFRNGQLSLFGGLGYTPEIDDGDPNGITLAVGLRGFTPGTRHRGLLELSVAQIGIQTPGLVLRAGNFERVDGKRLYGPGIQAGYQYTANSGFTLMLTAGVGYALGRDEEAANAVKPLMGLGFGYTWR